MKTSLRTAFNEDAQNYDIARPDYPEELFTDILSYLDERKAGKSAIEIGIGTGQATKPFLDAGFQVTAIELGDKLAAYAAEKFRAYPSLHFHVRTSWRQRRKLLGPLIFCTPRRRFIGCRSRMGTFGQRRCFGTAA